MIYMQSGGKNVNGVILKRISKFTIGLMKTYFTRNPVTLKFCVEGATKENMASKREKESSKEIFKISENFNLSPVILNTARVRIVEPI